MIAAVSEEKASGNSRWHMCDVSLDESPSEISPSEESAPSRQGQETGEMPEQVETKREKGSHDRDPGANREQRLEAVHVRVTPTVIRLACSEKSIFRWEIDLI